MVRKQLPVVIQSIPSIATTLGLSKSSRNGGMVKVGGVENDNENDNEALSVAHDVRNRSWGHNFIEAPITDLFSGWSCKGQKARHCELRRATAQASVGGFCHSHCQPQLRCVRRILFF